MKKLTLAVLSCALLFGMSGCSDATTKISNGSETLLTIGKEEVTNQDLYNVLLRQGQITSIINLVTEKLIDLEVPVTDEIRAEAQKSFDALKASVGENFIKLVNNAGYETEEEYFEERVLFTARAAKLSNIYLETNFDQSIADYKPRKVEIVEFTKEENAKNALAAIQGGKSVAEAGKEFDTSKTYDGVTMIVNNATGLDSTVFKKISDAKETGLIEEVLVNSDKTKWYVVSLVDVDPTNFKEDAITNMATITAVGDAAFAYYLKQYNFRIYDIDLYNAFEQQAPKFIVQ
ncbi:MAG: hypothetical protein ACRDBX_04400 [Erysipelotrichaceae bacterium]